MKRHLSRDKLAALLLRRAAHIPLAAEATNPAENMPDGVAIGVTTGIAREEKHRATSFSEFVSRRHYELYPPYHNLSSCKYYHTLSQDLVKINYSSA
ncbi:MAG: hypothetical protein IJV82_04705 [Oscillospiraceae bacterium]|nr:hypothetical protein [Oscillospiraceae bacterium]